MSLAVRQPQQPSPPEEGEVHIWHLHAKDLNARDSALLALLHQNEIERLHQFLHEERRAEFLAARVAIRSTLSHYFPLLSPSAWRFAAGEFGKPNVTNCPLADLEFNLSHAGGVVVCAVTRGRAVGIDIESTERKCEIKEIAHSHFAAAEVADLELQPDETLVNRFFEIWTLKEAYIKARGMGLSLPLDQFAFRIQKDRREIGISFAPQLADVSSHWRFHLAKFSGMQLAVALHDPAHAGLRILHQGRVPTP